MDPKIRQSLVRDAVDMYEEGMSIGTIVQELGKSTSTIYELLREGGVEPNRRDEGPRKKVSDVLPEDVVKGVVADYVAGVSVARIMRTTGLTINTVYKILKEQNTELRRGEDSRETVRIRVDQAVQMYKDGAKLIKIEVETGVQSTQLYKELYKQGVPLRRDIP